MLLDSKFHDQQLDKFVPDDPIGDQEFELIATELEEDECTLHSPGLRTERELIDQVL